MGYAYCAPWKTRPAYRATVENSIYVAPWALGRGCGRELLRDLLAACRDAGIREVIAVIADGEDSASVELHRRFGFVDAGRLTRVGYQARALCRYRAAASGVRVDGLFTGCLAVLRCAAGPHGKMGRVLRWTTAGESHGRALVAVVEGMVAGVGVTSGDIASRVAGAASAMGAAPG